MKKFIGLFSVLSVVVLGFVAAGSTFAGGSGLNTADYIYFRVDTELDVPAYYGSNGPTVRWTCDGTTYGEVTDGTASDSDGIVNGVIKIASVSLEMDDAQSGCDATETITATTSFNGWVTRKVTSTIANTANFAVRASMDYTLVVNGIADELGSSLTLNGSIASATYSSTTASQSYVGGKKYIAVTSSGGTVTAGANGYVNRTSSTISVSSTSSKSVDFGMTDNSSLNENGLLFGLKIAVFPPRGNIVDNPITAGSVQAGNDYGTSCASGGGANAGYWYCAVPLADTGVIARYSRSGWETVTASYFDRAAGSDPQSAATLNPSQLSSGGGGGGGGSVAYSEVTPTPSASVEPTVTPTPTATATPSVTSSTPSPNIVTPIPTPYYTPVPLPSYTSGISQIVSLAKSFGYGAKGSLVTALQQFLIAKNAGPNARKLAQIGATGNFYSLTKAALAEYQAKVGIKPASGYLGPITRAHLKTLGF